MIEIREEEIEGAIRHGARSREEAIETIMALRNPRTPGSEPPNEEEISEYSNRRLLKSISATERSGAAPDEIWRDDITMGQRKQILLDEKARRGI